MRTRSRASLASLTACLATVTACEKQAAPRPAATGSAGGSPATTSAPTLAELRNATYTGLSVAQGPVQLVEGRWEGAPIVAGGVLRSAVQFVRDFHLLRDLDGDGIDEAVVLLSESSGGSGAMLDMAVVSRRQGGLQNIATQPIGDRVQVRDARFESSRITLDVLQAGENDAMCCPGDLVTRSWELKSNGLREGPTSTPARLSLDTLAGKEWMLVAWSWDEPAPDAPEITLQYQDGRFAGKSGCNRYSAPATPGKQPGHVSLGSAIGTRMACAEDVMPLEGRYLAQLGRVKKFGYMVGQLALTYEKDGGMDAMLFEAREPR